jgi:hypothetical protein
MQVEKEQRKKRVAEEELEVGEERENKRLKQLPQADGWTEEIWRLVNFEPSGVAVEMRKWIEECDPALLLFDVEEHNTSISNEGKESEIFTEILSVTRYACAHHYATRLDKDGGIAELDVDEMKSDIALCDGVCSLIILHTIADLWFYLPGVYYGSYQIQLLFNVLRWHLTKKQRKSNSEIAALLARMMELGAGVARKEIITVPLQCHNLLAVMYYSNLSLVLRNRACTRDVKHPTFGFSDIVRANLFPEELPYRSVRDTILPRDANKERDLIVNLFNEYLVTRSTPEKLTPQPLRMVKEYHYCVKSESEYLRI